MKLLHIGKGLSLPLAVVTEKLGWLGVTGGGKSYAATKLAELLWYAGAQFLVLDPVGVWYGLRLAKDGKKPSDIQIPIFGGLRGDVPLEPSSGTMMANLVADRGISAILDVSQFETDSDKARFAADFANRYFFRKKSSPSAVHLFIEECQEFVPQNPMKGEERMLHAFTRLQKLGRNFGIGSSYISQRPQEVNKKALNMAQTLFVFRTTGTHERAAIEKWIEDKSLDQDIAADLPKLPTGVCHVWSPEFLKISETVHIHEKLTFDSSETPKVGAVTAPRQLAPIDLVKIRTEMAATIERAKAEDPRELRKEIATLRKELAAKSAKQAEVVEKIVREKPIIKEADLVRLEKIGERYEEQGAKLKEMGAVFVSLAQTERVRAKEQAAPPAHGQSGFFIPGGFPTKKMRKEFEDIVRPLGYEPHGRPKTAPSGDLTPTASAVLSTIGQFQSGATRQRIAVMSGRSIKSSSFQSAFPALEAKGLIQKNGDKYSVTAAGAEIAGAEPLPSGPALLGHWLRKLSPSEGKILHAIADAHPKAVTREQVAEATGQSMKSSSFQSAFPALRDLELIEGRSEFTASEAFF